MPKSRLESINPHSLQVLRILTIKKNAMSNKRTVLKDNNDSVRKN